MANKSRISGKMDEQELEWSTTTVMLYLMGGKPSDFDGKPSEAKSVAAKAFLDALSKNQVDKLDELGLRRSEQADREINQFISDIVKSSPVAREKFLNVIDAGDLQLSAARSAPKELAVQQQQAYLNLLGYDIGKAGLDGISGKGSMTQKAMDQFAKENGIDPKDTAKVNQVLFATAVTLQPKSSFEAMLKKIEAGTTGPDGIKTVQWLLKGAGANMPLSLHGDKMDGIAGPETKTVLRVHTYNSGNERDTSITNVPPKAPVTDPKTDPQLQKFYESLSPEQRDIQKKIAERGGSQPYGEAVGILYELADDYFHGRKVQGNIYDGGFPQGTPDHFRFPYEPSEEVYKLKKEFDKSLTPEQKKLREQYESSEAKRDVGLKRVVLPDFELEVIGRSPLKLFRENVPDLLRDSLKSSEDLKLGIDNKLSQSPGHEDVLWERGIQGIDLSGAFRNGALGEMVSAPSPDAGVALGNQKLFEMPTVRPMGGAPKI